MRVETAKQETFGQPNGVAREAVSGNSTAQATECRALALTAPATAPKPRALPRQAAFLAHLIATEQQAPQTRHRRRVEPSEALAAYRTAAALTR